MPRNHELHPTFSLRFTLEHRKVLVHIAQCILPFWIAVAHDIFILGVEIVESRRTGCQDPAAFSESAFRSSKFCPRSDDDFQPHILLYMAAT